MIIKIIRLQTHDDVLSVCEEMERSQARRVLLIWPERGRILNQKLDLVLIQRRGRKLGRQLGLVSSDSDVKYYANQIGLPIFANERAAQTASWRGGRRRRRPSPPKIRPSSAQLERPAPPRQPAAGWVRWPAFLAGILALLAILAALLPAAALQIKIPQQTQQTGLGVYASEDIEQVNLAGGLPARRLVVIVEGRDSLPTSGKLKAPSAPASGKVLFTNLTDQPVEVPLGTLLNPLDSAANPDQAGIRFATTQAGRVPAGAGKTLSLPVQALQPGAAGNLKANQLQVIQGRLGLRLSATNPAAFSGGLDLTVAGPTAKDRQVLMQQLMQQLQQSALAELQTLANQSDPYLPSIVITPTLRLSQVLNQVYDPAPEIAAETLQLNLRLEFEALVVEGSDLRRLVTPILDASLPKNYLAQPSSLSLAHNTLEYELAEGVSRWYLTASRTIQLSLTQAAVAQAGRGLPRSSAARQIQQRLGLAKAPQIQVWPDWWPYLPLLPVRFQVEILLPPTSP